MPHRRPPSAAFTLLELLMVIAVVGILAAVILPSSQPGLHEQLQGTARIVATELAYGRSLAVGNNSSYRFTFDLKRNRLVLEHSGSNPALNKLPASPFRAAGDPSSQQILDLDDLPHVGPAVMLLVAATSDSSPQPVSTLEFGPLGATTRTSGTTIWLSAGSGSRARYISLQVNPVTGLVEVGSFSSSGPPAALVSSASSN